MSNSLNNKRRIDKLLRNVNTGDIELARESIAPLMTQERKRDVTWLCSLCYLLGKSDGA